MSTKMKGDIAEQAVILASLKKSWNVLTPVGDRLAYDLVFEIDNRFIKIQVKAAWFDAKKSNWVVDVRRTKTNRREIKRTSYQNDDFDFAILCIIELNVFYVMPIDVFVSYGSEIHLVEDEKRQRKPKSAEFREAWHLIT